MKQKIAIIVSLVLIVGLMWTGSAFAQEVDQDGYPIVFEVTEEITPEVTEEPEEINPVCEGELNHPVIMRIADQYNMDYEELTGYFCEYDFGVGEIVHLLATYNQMDDETTTLEDILAMRSDDEMGWGEIWQNLGLIGSGRNKSEEEQTEALVRNQNRNKYNQQSGMDDEEPFNNGNKPDSPPGLEKENNPNKPVTPPGKDKGNGHPGNGKKP